MKEKIIMELDEVTFRGKEVKKNPKKYNIKKDDADGYFLSQSKKFGGGGGYIPCPIKFTNERVCVIVLKRGKKNG